jgi:hypothetical protein
MMFAICRSGTTNDAIFRKNGILPVLQSTRPSRVSHSIGSKYRLALLALCRTPFNKTILNRFVRTNPAVGAIFGSQFDNSSLNSLYNKDFFGFLDEK